MITKINFEHWHIKKLITDSPNGGQKLFSGVKGISKNAIS